MDIALYLLAALLIVGGLVGAVLPTLPGIPMLFGGIWLVAAVDHYRHLGLGWLLLLGALGTLGVIVDFVAATLGARRVGASRTALWGASFGMLIGMFFGVPGCCSGRSRARCWASWPAAPACCVPPMSASAPGSACCLARWSSWWSR